MDLTERNYIHYSEKENICWQHLSVVSSVQGLFELGGPRQFSLKLQW